MRTPRLPDRVDAKIRKLDPLDFEELCAELVTSLGFVNVRRQGSGTQFGHDLAAELLCEHQRLESWFFECKRYARTIPLKEVSNKLLWADTVERLDYFVIISNAQISNDFRQLVSMRSSRPYKILTWTGPVFRRLLLSCRSTYYSWFRATASDGALNEVGFLAEQRGSAVGHRVRNELDRSTVTITITRSPDTPGDDPCYAVITDYAGNELASVTLTAGRKIQVQLPKEALGKPVRVWYDFNPNACMARHYPQVENILVDRQLSLPTSHLTQRNAAVCAIPFESWQSYLGDV